MATIVLGSLPEPLEVQLVHGDGATLVATLVDSEGVETAWSDVPTLQFAGVAGTVVASHVAVVDVAEATWTLTSTHVDTIWDATRALSQSAFVRLTLPDGDDGSVEYAGSVVWSDGWTAGATTQTVSFTVSGPTGAGVPAGGTTGQVLAKNSNTDYDTEWVPGGGGGGGAVDSVNGETGVVVLDAADVGAQPVDSDLTAIAALTTTSYGRAFLELANQAALVALLPSYQPLDSDLTAIAALSTTAYGRGLLALADAAALKTSLTLVKADVGLGNVDNTSDANKPVSTATQTALDGKAPVRATINAQTGTTYTIVLSDENKLVTLTNAGAITVTLPQDSAVAIPVGGRIDFAVLGAGMATFVAGTGATANGTPSLVTRAQYSAASAIKVAANTWLVVGDLA